MADFEFYTANVPVEPTGAVSAPSETMQSVLGKALSSVGEAQLAKTMRVRKEVGLEKSSEAGTMAGNKLGFVPRETNSEEDIAYNRAALQAQKMAIQNDIRSHVMEIQTDVLNNSNLNSVNEYDERMKSYSGALLPQLTPAMRDYAKNNLEYYGLTHRQPVMREVGNLHKNMIQSNVQLSYNNNFRDATQAAYEGNQNAAFALRTNTVKNLDAALVSGNISPGYKTQAITQLDKSMKFARYTGEFNQAIQNNKAREGFADFLKTDQKDLLPDEKRELVTRFKGMINDHKQEIYAQYGNINSKVRDLATSIYLNGTNAATMGQIANMKSVISDFYSERPDKAQELNRDLDFAVERNNFSNSIKYVPESDIQSAVFDKEKELKQNPTFQRAQEFRQLTQDAERVLRERKTNLYQITSQNPTVQAMTTAQRNANQANVGMTTGAKLGSATVSSIQDRDEAMIQIQKQMGIHPSDYEIVAPEDIQALGQMISEGDPVKSINALQTILAQHQGHEGEAWNQIQKSIKQPLALVYNGAMNPETMPRRDYMFAAASSKAADLEKLIPDAAKRSSIKNDVTKYIMQDYGDAIMNKNGNPTQILAGINDYTYKLALVYQQAGISGAAQQAVNDALLAHVSLSTYNGKRFFIPKNTNYSINDIKKASDTLLNNLDPKKLHVPTTFRPGEKDDIRQQAYKDFLISDGYPALRNDNTGMILLNGARQPINIVDGNSKNQRALKELSFDFKDLNIPSSDLHKAIEKQKTPLSMRYVSIASKTLSAITGV